MAWIDGEEEEIAASGNSQLNTTTPQVIAVILFPCELSRLRCTLTRICTRILILFAIITYYIMANNVACNYA